MASSILHITNGSSTTEYLDKLEIEGEIITWHEMLCEGPTVKEIDTDAFIETRKTFLEKTYDIEYNVEEFKTELELLNKINSYSEVVLWFEYDLFCHINLIAVISLLKQKDVRIPIYLVCSGRILDEKGKITLKGLGQLTPAQLKEHYANKIQLDIDDIALAQKAWRIYCENDHNLLKPLILRPSNFKYLSICLKAHIKRFADSRSGLGNLEYNILKLIKEYHIKSRHHLLGYTLHYQGYYGFGDIQIKRLIDNLELFYDETETDLKLNRNGHLALEHQKNFFGELNTDFEFGGVNKKDFQYDKKLNKLIKTSINAY